MYGVNMEIYLRGKKCSYLDNAFKDFLSIKTIRSNLLDVLLN